jgi:gamma-glutamylcyclotransferase (GGCT)/AIG2-like uncharacterized protein YtfP
MNRSSDNATLFVYGTLLNPAERIRLLGRAVDGSAARLSGYARGQKRYFFVARREGAHTEGMLLKELTPRDFEILDEYEGVPRLYKRELVVANDNGGSPIECWVYLPTGWAGEASRK